MNPVNALIITNIIWGAAAPIFKYALENIPPFTLAFIRFFGAGLIFIPLAVHHWQKINKRQWLEILLVGFFGVTINISFFFLGLPRSTSINVPVIASSGPVFIYLFSIIFLHEKPKYKVFSGMMVALFGVLVIILSPVLGNGTGLNLGKVGGNVFFLIATFGTVFQIIFGKDILKKVNPCQVTAISFLFGSMTFLPLMITELDSWGFHQLNGQGILGIIFGVFFSSAVAYFLFYYGMSKIKAQEVGLFTYIDPIVAALIAMPLLGEYPDLYFFIGALLIFSGIFIAEKRIHYHPFNRLKLISHK